MVWWHRHVKADMQKMVRIGLCMCTFMHVCVHVSVDVYEYLCVCMHVNVDAIDLLYCCLVESKPSLYSHSSAALIIFFNFSLSAPMICVLIVLYSVLLCYIIQCYIMLCYVVLCCVYNITAW